MVAYGHFTIKKLFFAIIFVFVSALLLLSKTVLRNQSASEPPPLPLHVPPTKSVISLPIFSSRTAKPCPPSSPPTLLVIVHSSPSHVVHRRAIRQTWGHSTKTTRTVFVVGRSKLPKLQQRILLESDQHGDIVGVDMEDSYTNLTLKHLSGLKWALKNCPGASYILKADDDAFVNVPRAISLLQSALSAELSPNVIACRVFPEGTSPRRSGKWMVSPQEYPHQEYPEYCSGLAYFARPVTLSRVYETAVSGRVPYLWVDDVFVTGLAAREAGVGRLDLGVWFARTENVVVKWMRNGDTTRILPWIVAEMTPRHWPADAEELWRKVQTVQKNTPID